MLERVGFEEVDKTRRMSQGKEGRDKDNREKQ